MPVPWVLVLPLRLKASEKEELRARPQTTPSQTALSLLAVHFAKPARPMAGGAELEARVQQVVQEQEQMWMGLMDWCALSQLRASA